MYACVYIHMHALLVYWECIQKRWHKSSGGGKKRQCQGQAAHTEERTAFNTWLCFNFLLFMSTFWNTASGARWRDQDRQMYQINNSTKYKCARVGVRLWETENEWETKWGDRESSVLGLEKVCVWCVCVRERDGEWKNTQKNLRKCWNVLCLGPREI